MAQADPRAKLVNSYLQRLNLSVRWLAVKIGSNHVSVGDWLNGDAKPRNARVWSDMLSVLEEHEKTMGSSGADVKIRKVGLRRIVVYPGLSAGPMGSTYADTGSMEIKDWGTDAERWGRVIDGFSMSPLLEPGDTAIFENRQWETWHVVQAFDNGADTVKIARKVDGGVQLVPLNPDYEIIDGRNANIKGVLVGRVRKTADEESETVWRFGRRERPEWLP